MVIPKVSLQGPATTPGVNTADPITPNRTSRLWLMRSAIVLSLVALAFAPQVWAKQEACPALLNHSFPRLQDDVAQNLCQYRGQVVLVVNTASYCGFTQQYDGLEKLYARFKDRGLVVVGFPSPATWSWRSTRRAWAITPAARRNSATSAAAAISSPRRKSRRCSAAAWRAKSRPSWRSRHRA